VPLWTWARPQLSITCKLSRSTRKWHGKFSSRTTRTICTTSTWTGRAVPSQLGSISTW
jgi:hypothetical protein